MLGDNEARQADDDRVRLWEIAGTAHGDAYLVIAAPFDDGSLTAERFAELLTPSREVLGAVSDEPINAGPHQHYVAQAALHRRPRPLAPRRDTAPGGAPPGSSARRWLPARPAGQRRAAASAPPWVDAPTAVTSPGSAASAVAGPASSAGTAPFDGTTLGVDVSGRQVRITWRRRGGALVEAIQAGFMLEADRPEIEAVLAAGYPERTASGQGRFRPTRCDLPGGAVTHTADTDVGGAVQDDAHLPADRLRPCRQRHLAQRHRDGVGQGDHHDRPARHRRSLMRMSGGTLAGWIGRSRSRP